MRLAAVFLLAALPAAAQEFVVVPGPLTDEEFYRAVACAAPPGDACQKPILRWPEDKRQDLTVALVSVTPALLPYQRAIFEAGLDAALGQINALDAGVRLTRIAGGRGATDIAIHVVATPPGQVMEDTGVEGLDGNVLPLGRVALRARDNEIREALIAISAQARRREIASILLEEVTQALGLMTDIEGPDYRRSVFAETGNSVVRLEGQDAMALRRHYRGAPTADEES
ncbi:DUF2927 domain-containing protein [Jannaschia sp. M317]|uniref:DUF2927 domain-containing protein n=1 Tax=Jannaschia sp. M317 TaxID=2867011 RepID=UPI0021A92930|nr:DUF2927 domain-containing protein [Jannaschia sp. M317]UWQ18838.1 DUF2927 domain-containing protein [Jannaschia sp. M317]